MLQPVLQCEQTPSVVFRYQTRCLYRKSLLPSAPTGQRSTTLPASLLSSGRPGKTSISSWWPRLITCSSAVPLISRVKRTHRVHMMQRSVNSVIFAPSSGLFGGVFFSSMQPRLGAAVVVAEVLQLALAGLVADRAIERMVDEQPFERIGLGFLGPFAGLAAPGEIGGIIQSGMGPVAFAVIAGNDDRAVFDRRLATRHDLRLHHHRAVRLALADLDEAHSARRHDRERFVVAVMGNEHAGAIRGLNTVELAGADLHRRIVHENRWHFEQLV